MLIIPSNAATYRFRDIRGQMAKIEAQNFGFGGSLGALPQNGEDLSGAHIYRHAKSHADLCHRRRDIYWHNRTEEKQQISGGKLLA